MSWELATVNVYSDSTIGIVAPYRSDSCHVLAGLRRALSALPSAVMRRTFTRAVMMRSDDNDDDCRCRARTLRR